MSSILMQSANSHKHLCLSLSRSLFYHPQKPTQMYTYMCVCVWTSGTARALPSPYHDHNIYSHTHTLKFGLDVVAPEIRCEMLSFVNTNPIKTRCITISLCVRGTSEYIFFGKASIAFSIYMYASYIE